MSTGSSDQNEQHVQILAKFLEVDQNAVPPFIHISTGHPYTIFFVSTVFLTMFFDYGVIMFTIRKINSTVNASTTISRKAHTYILRVLIVQATIPLIMCIPLTLIVIREVFSIDNILLSALSKPIGFWYTLFKCLAMILVVPAYRRPFLRLFTLRCCQNRLDRVERIDRSTTTKQMHSKSAMC
ncbi:hypothetical protein M3Y97_00850900 [Aphelenchoides bicaudatus]|nr:hypothetical protein M3Y97_00850900 [Aphelenchoides bicaudatus]